MELGDQVKEESDRHAEKHTKTPQEKEIRREKHPQANLYEHRTAV